MMALLTIQLHVGPADDLLALLERCKGGLKPGGLMIFKENVCENGFVVDPVRSFLTLDPPVTRDL